MSELQEIKKRLRSFVINSKTETELIDTDFMSSFELTDLIISNPKEKKLILNVTDNDGNVFNLLECSSNFSHSFPTGFRFWRDAKLIAITDDMINSEIIITLGYMKVREALDINTWRLI